MRCFCFFNATATTEYYTDLHTLALHDPLPISDQRVQRRDLLLRRSPPDGPLLHVHRRAQAPAGAVGHLRPWVGHDVQRAAEGGQYPAAQGDQLERRDTELFFLLRTARGGRKHRLYEVQSRSNGGLGRGGS